MTRGDEIRAMTDEKLAKTEYIEREAAIELLQGPITMSMCLSKDECISKNWQRGIDLVLIKAIPAADVAPVRHGRWLWDDEGYHCSECWYLTDNATPWCPVCGAKMDGGET